MTQNTINNLQFSSLNIVTFTSSGTYTPGPKVLGVHVTCTGGGGGSGGLAATDGTQRAASGSAGSGSVTQQVFARSQLTPSVVVTVGLGGPGGAAGANAGANGGTTTFLTVSAGGGEGTAGGAATTGTAVAPAGLGGVATGGAVNIPGTIAKTTSITGTTPVTRSWPSKAYAATGFGAGGEGELSNLNAPAKPGVDGGDGQVTIIEYLSV